MKRLNTLFRRTVLTLGLSLFIYSVIAVLIINYFILHPMVERGADDLAALMTLASKTWVELPTNTRADFQHELLLNHGLQIRQAIKQPGGITLKNSYFTHLTESLEWRTGEKIRLSQSTENSQRWVWADIPAGGKELQVGFNAERIGQSSIAGILIFSSGFIVLAVATFTLVPRLTKPLECLQEAVQRFGKNSKPQPIKEQGPEELVNLARNFNQMQEQISELLANRTTLLAGISHDLRTPLARTRLAIELLSGGNNQELLEGIYGDLDEMEQLISQTMILAKEMSPSDLEPIDLPELIDGVVADFRRTACRINWQPRGYCPCDTNPGALRRVLTNLLENAQRYGQGKPVTIGFSCNENAAQIKIRDQGPGIDEHDQARVMQPFQRLDESRSRSTGGSGLGLAIVHQLCKSHGWTISIKNASGGGLIASLTIPIRGALDTQA